MNEVTQQQGSRDLVIRADQSDWTTEQATALFDMFGIGDAPLPVIHGYFHVCKTTGLDPFRRQIHLIERAGKWTPQTSIDGFRIIRDRSGVYDGDETFWAGPDGVWQEAWLDPDNPPVAAKFVLYVKGRSKPVTAVALWREYVQTKRDGSTTSMWARMSAHMLAKVAEALAIRKAFPDDTGGLYTDDEMAQASNEPQLEPGETMASRRRDRSPGIMDLDEPPVQKSGAHYATQDVGGGFMDAPAAASAEDPNVVDAEIVEEPVSQPEAHAAAAPAPEPAREAPQPAEAAPTPENAVPAEEQGAPMNMNPEPDPGPQHKWIWSGKLVEVLEQPGFDLYKLRVVYDEAAAAGALGDPVPWAGRSFEETVQAIRANLEAGNDPVAGIQ